MSVSIDSSHAFVFLKILMYPNVLWEQSLGVHLTVNNLVHIISDWGK
jgi:hypothetical protein